MRVRRGVALVEVILATALVAIEGAIVAEQVAQQVRAARAATQRESELRQLSQVLTAMTLLEAAELLARVGKHDKQGLSTWVEARPDGSFQVRVSVQGSGASLETVMFP